MAILKFITNFVMGRTVPKLFSNIVFSRQLCPAAFEFYLQDTLKGQRIILQYVCISLALENDAGASAGTECKREIIDVSWNNSESSS
jgi:hypothetical protein